MKKLVLTLSIICAGAGAFAQNKNIVVLGGNKSSNSKKSSKKQSPESSMAVKVGVVNFIAGNFPICIEKEYNNFSLLVGAGPTFRRFYNQSWWSTAINEDAVDYSWGDQYNNGAHSAFNSEDEMKYQYTPGYYYVINPRYYYNEEGMEGGYIGFQFDGMQYNYKNQGYGSKAFNKSGRDRYTDVLFQWGHQSDGDHVVFEWFTGLGIRFKDELRYAYTTGNMGEIVEGTGQIKKSSLRFDIGFRVGFKF